jgi:hypothetical protein
VAHRIEQVLLRPAMGIMAGDAGCGTRFQPLVNIEKACASLFVTLGAELIDGSRGQLGVIGAVGTMTGGAVLGGGGMGGAVPPVFCHIAMAVEAEGRLPLVQITGMG